LLKNANRNLKAEQVGRFVYAKNSWLENFKKEKPGKKLEQNLQLCVKSRLVLTANRRNCWDFARFKDKNFSVNSLWPRDESFKSATSPVRNR